MYHFLSPDEDHQFASPYSFAANPMLLRDSDGNFFFFVLGTIFLGAAIGIVTEVIEEAIPGDGFSAEKIFRAGGIGAIAGGVGAIFTFIPGMGGIIGFTLAGMLEGALIGGGNEMARNWDNGTNVFGGNFLMAFGIGAAGGALFGRLGAKSGIRAKAKLPTVKEAFKRARGRRMEDFSDIELGQMGASGRLALVARRNIAHFNNDPIVFQAETSTLLNVTRGANVSNDVESMMLQYIPNPLQRRQIRTMMP